MDNKLDSLTEIEQKHIKDGFLVKVTSVTWEGVSILETDVVKLVIEADIIPKSKNTNNTAFDQAKGAINGA